MFDPGTLTPEQRRELEARFWAKVDRRGPDDCWLWTAGIRSKNGYGLFVVRHGQMEAAHRVAWLLTHGPVQDGILILHCCAGRYPVGDLTNRRCVNPAHLKAATNEQNSKDMVSDGRQAFGDRSGSRLHPESLARGDRNGSRLHPDTRPRGERHACHVLSEPEVLEILRRRAAGEKHTFLAREFGVTEQAVSLIVRRKKWRHITCPFSR